MAALQTPFIDGLCYFPRQQGSGLINCASAGRTWLQQFLNARRFNYDDSVRPVLKHGPRSLTSTRAFGCQTRTRSESERRWEPLWGAPSTDPDVFGWI